MKILVISNLYPPDFLGGYELGCRQVTDALRAAGHDVRVLTAAPRVPVPHDPLVLRRLRLADIYDGYSQTAARPSTVRSRALEAHTVQAFNVHALTDVLADFRPDVAYVWNTVGLGGLGLLAALQHLGVPWVMHLMDDIPRSLCSLEGPVLGAVAAAFNGLCQGRFICCSRTTLDEIQAVGVHIADKTALIPNWVTTAGSPGRTSYQTDGQLRIVTAGSMSPSKGIGILIQAAGLLRDRGRTGFAVDIYGPGSDAQFRTAIQSRGLDEVVRVKGVRSQAELAALYPTYDVFAFPTWAREPFGFAPMEAMAHGCLAVVSRLCGFAEWFIDGIDCLKTDRDPEALADALDRVLTGQVSVAAVGGRGGRAVLGHFHLSVLLPRIVAELTRAAAARRPAAGPPDEAYRIAVLAEKTLAALIQETAAA